MTRRTAALLVSMLALSGTAAAETRPDRTGFTRTEAERRAALLSDVKYQPQFDLDTTAPDFTGTVTTAFNAAKAGEPLTIDFEGGRIERVEVNGTAESKPVYNGKFLTLSGKGLKAGPNTVLIRFAHPYSTTGN